MNNLTTVLIADDHEIYLYGLKVLLKKEKTFLVKSVTDGKELIQLGLEFDFDLIIADYHLPRKNGIEALGRIKKVKPNTKTILISSLEEDRIQDIVKIEKIDAYIFKSEDKLSFIKAVKNVLAGDTYYSNKKRIEKDFLWNHTANPFLKLSQREIEILKEMISGKSLKDTASHLKLSSKTIDNHRMNLKKKLNMSIDKIIEEAKIWGLK
jgi:DNA-binding NarL/FixJ family response regulator